MNAQIQGYQTLKDHPAKDGQLQVLVRRLQHTRKFAFLWKRLNDSGDVPKYFNATRGPSIWEVFRRIEARAEKARLTHAAALRAWVEMRTKPNATGQAHEHKIP